MTRSFGPKPRRDIFSEALEMAKGAARLEALAQKMGAA